jgi:dsRNA-specific ribonuclease
LFLLTNPSVLGSNKELTEKCKYFSIDRFILTAPLSRGQWTPSSLEMASSGKPKSPLPSEKVCADVIEALLGLAYREKGYALALKVADELRLTVPWSDDIRVEGGRKEASNPKLAKVAIDFTGYERFHRSILVEEAFTHPTSLHPETSSYQRLEWIGDAVLCLAAREWLFEEFPDTPVGDMVLMEASLVANETLAYLSLRSGLQRHLNHRDQTLPARIESYDWSVREHGRGLWGTDPPKAIADVVESLLGAVHVDGGFESGQKAALHVLAPIREFFRSVGETTALIRHPKMCLLELGGELVSVPTWREEEYAQAKKCPTVWQGQGFGPVNRNGHKEVASVQCLGVDLVSLSDRSRSSATNRACAIVLAALEGNPALLNRFKSARSRIASKTNQIAAQKQDREL